MTLIIVITPITLITLITSNPNNSNDLNNSYSITIFHSKPNTLNNCIILPTIVMAVVFLTFNTF